VSYSDRVITFRLETDEGPLPEWRHFVVKVPQAGGCVMLAYVELYAAEWDRLEEAAPEEQLAFAASLQGDILAALEQRRTHHE